MGLDLIESVCRCLHSVNIFFGSSSIELLSTTTTFRFSSLQMYSGSLVSSLSASSKCSKEWQPPIVSGRLFNMLLPSCNVWSLVMYPIDSGIIRRWLCSTFKCSRFIRRPIVEGSSKMLLLVKICLQGKRRKRKKGG